MGKKQHKFDAKREFDYLDDKVYYLGLAFNAISEWCGEIEGKVNRINKAQKGLKKSMHKHENGGNHLLMCALPKPCDGDLYADWSFMDFMSKPWEEMTEMMEAANKWQATHTEEDRQRFLREATDAIIAITSAMNKAGADLAERQKIMVEVNKSNAVRDGGRRFKKEA
jgi:hypothetical protein